ncbi:MAG: M50 family metallopeptidase [Pseudomonadota bacterium]
MSSVIDARPWRPRNPAPPPHWNPFAPLVWQLLAAIAIAASFVAVLVLTVPVTFAFCTEMTVIFIHEAGHGLLAWVGDGHIHRLTVRADGSGLAHVAHGGGAHGVLVYGAGLALPALIGALLMATALTRCGLDVVPIVLAGLTGALTYLFVDGEPAVKLALYGVAAGLFVTGLVPMPGPLKAGLVGMVAAAITHAVVRSASYASVEYIGGDPERPSDARLIADALELSSIEEVTAALLGVMIAFYVVAGLFSWAWLARHWR